MQPIVRIQLGFMTVSTTLCTVLLLYTVSTLWAGQVALTWDRPLTNSDGSDLDDLQGYKVHFGPISGEGETDPTRFQYERALPEGTALIPAGTTSFTIPDLQENVTYFFAVTAIDFAGNQSLYSSEVSATIPDAPPAPPANAFLQDSATGLISLEGEHFHTNTAQGSHTWTVGPITGASGGEAVEATPNQGTNNNTGYTTASPRLDFAVYFAHTGTHYVWVRGIGASGRDDSVHVGVDGQATASSARISSFGTTWTWSQNTMDGTLATLEVPTAGLHTVNVWMREDGFVLDKVLLTTSASFTPSGTGPTESPAYDDTGNDNGTGSDQAITLVDADFNGGPDGFSYADDVFYTSQPAYASGNVSGGALRVTLGGIDGADILDMSGGWHTSFTLTVPAAVRVIVDYRLTQTSNYEPDEFSQFLVSVDEILYGELPNDYVEEIAGGGSTGWWVFETSVGTLTAGEHVLTIGGYNNKKTQVEESTTVEIDAVIVETESASVPGN